MRIDCQVRFFWFLIFCRHGDVWISIQNFQFLILNLKLTELILFRAALKETPCKLQDKNAVFKHLPYRKKSPPSTVPKKTFHFTLIALICKHKLQSFLRLPAVFLLVFVQLFFSLFLYLFYIVSIRYHIVFLIIFWWSLFYVLLFRDRGINYGIIQRGICSPIDCLFYYVKKCNCVFTLCCLLFFLNKNSFSCVSFMFYEMTF